MLQDRIFVDFVLNLQTCASVQDSYALFSKTLKQFGITETVYAMVLGSKDYLGLSDYRPDFIEAYEAVGGVASDFTVQWSRSNEQTLVWDNTRNADILTQAQYELERVSVDFNIESGFTLPVHTGVKGYWGTIGLSATGVERREFRRDILPLQKLMEAISSVFDMHIRQFSGDQVLALNNFGTLQRLAPAEKETLKWLAEGYSIKQIADEKLYRSVDSINLYIRGAKQKLKARNRDQLIARALILKLIP